MVSAVNPLVAPGPRQNDPHPILSTSSPALSSSPILTGGHTDVGLDGTQISWQNSAAYHALTSVDLVYLIARDLTACDRRAMWFAIKEGRDAWEPLIWETSHAGMLSCSVFVETERLIRKNGHEVDSLFITEPPSGRTYGNPRLEYSTAEHHYAFIWAVRRNSQFFTRLRVLCVRLTHDTSFHHLSNLLALPTLGHARLYFQRRGSVPSLVRALEALDVLQSLSSTLRHLHVTFPTFEGWSVYLEGYPTPSFFRTALSSLLMRLTALESLSLWNTIVDEGVVWPRLRALSYYGVPPNSMAARLERLELFLNNANYRSIEDLDAPLLVELCLSWKSIPTHPYELYRVCGVVDSKWRKTLNVFQLLVNRAAHAHPRSPPKITELIRRLRNCCLRRFSLMLQGDCSDDDIRLVYQQWPRLIEFHLYSSTLSSLWTPRTPTATALIEIMQHLPELRALTLSIDFDKMPFKSSYQNRIALHTSQKIIDLTLAICHATSVPTAADLVRRLCPRLKQLTLDNVHFREWTGQFHPAVIRSLSLSEFEPHRLVRVLPSVHRRKAERPAEREGWNLSSC